MYLAAKTVATPAETWAIVIVAVICLAFWLVMVVGIAPRPDVKKRQRQQQQALPVPFAGATPVPVSGGMHVAAGGRSVAPSRDAPAMEMPAPVEVPGRAAPDDDAEGTRETRDDLPTVPGQRRHPQPAGEPAGSSPLDLGPRMPAHRESATDQATPGRRPGR
jgi:hypothetical protein